MSSVVKKDTQWLCNSFLLTLNSILHNQLGTSSKNRKIKWCISSKGGGGGQTPNVNFFGCHFGNSIYYEQEVLKNCTVILGSKL